MESSANRTAALIYGSISTGAAALFFLVTSLTGDYPPWPASEERYGSCSSPSSSPCRSSYPVFAAAWSRPASRATSRRVPAARGENGTPQRFSQSTTKEVIIVKRFSIPRVARCSEGHQTRSWVWPETARLHSPLVPTRGADAPPGGPRVATAFVSQQPDLRQALPHRVVSHPVGGGPGWNTAARSASPQQHHDGAERGSSEKCFEMPALVKSDHPQSLVVGETVPEEMVDQTVVRERNIERPHAVSIVRTHQGTSAESEPCTEVQLHPVHVGATLGRGRIQ